MSTDPVQIPRRPAELKPAVAYALPHVSDTANELKRLDEMHESYKDYLDGRLSFAPLEESEPKRILELGAGSGAWAIQAANQFPNAEILGVDLSPIPSRTLPPNLKFQILNLMDPEPLPFKPETFDVVHSRFVFMHLPKPAEVISRVIQLVKPGGWLLLEDMNFNPRDEDGLELGPATKTWYEIYHSTMKSRGVENVFPPFESTINASGLFSEINARTVVLSVSEKSDDPKRNRLGAVFKTSLQRAAFNLAEGGYGFTHELAKELLEEVRDPSRNIGVDVTFTWSRKSMSLAGYSS